MLLLLVDAPLYISSPCFPLFEAPPPPPPPPPPRVVNESSQLAVVFAVVADDALARHFAAVEASFVVVVAVGVPVVFERACMLDMCYGEVARKNV